MYLVYSSLPYSFCFVFYPNKSTDKSLLFFTYQFFILKFNTRREMLQIFSLLQHLNVSSLFKSALFLLFCFLSQQKYGQIPPFFYLLVFYFKVLIQSELVFKKSCLIFHLQIYYFIFYVQLVIISLQGRLAIYLHACMMVFVMMGCVKSVCLTCLFVDTLELALIEVYLTVDFLQNQFLNSFILGLIVSLSALQNDINFCAISHKVWDKTFVLCFVVVQTYLFYCRYGYVEQISSVY
eukprot:TRINITY_DN11633_c1_g1_i1.p2 TRINITY_DN11633_c1_g1~~TRINITY_DN11633_c1_g1_i1.p2  ORF type:complete len:237 (-),score=-10.13 TRINITY_DN11633_c1_g1_i1:495-1205(-)